jgi:hypothetical protein
VIGRASNRPIDLGPMDRQQIRSQCRSSEAPDYGRGKLDLLKPVWSDFLDPNVIKTEVRATLHDERSRFLSSYRLRRSVPAIGHACSGCATPTSYAGTTAAVSAVSIRRKSVVPIQCSLTPKLRELLGRLLRRSTTPCLVPDSTLRSVRSSHHGRFDFPRSNSN